MVVWDSNQSHEPLVFLRAKGFLIDVRGISVDELGPATVWTEAGVVAMSLSPGRRMGVTFESSSRGGAGHVVVVVGIAAFN